MKFLLGLTILIATNSFGQSKISDCPTEAQLKKVYASALQSRAKDTLILQLEDRLKGMQFVIREFQIKDSFTVVGHKRETDISNNAKQAAIDEVAKKNRELKWANTQKDIWRGTAIAAIIYAAVKAFGK